MHAAVASAADAQVRGLPRACLRPTERFITDETNVLMDHVVRELVRLQRQVESLQQAIEELSPAQGGLAIAGEIDPETRSATEHLKVG